MSKNNVPDNACRVCSETITNPICQDCLEKEMIAWVVDYDKELGNEVIISSKVFVKTRCTDVNCIICNSLMEVCPHCYSKEVLRGIYKKSPAIAENFVRTFNYDLV